MTFTVMIPARLGSSRLPGKPLVDILGEPMIRHVHDRARESGAGEIYVVTDSDEVKEAVAAFGGSCIMTSTSCQSGTERLAEAVKKLDMAPEQIVVNLQGDEPMMSPRCIQQVAQGLRQHPDCSIATLCETISDMAEMRDPNIVKVIRDARYCALYFSRAPIPWDRTHFGRHESEDRVSGRGSRLGWRHIGLYAYRAGYILDYVDRGPCFLEETESLEQLRALYHGDRILVLEANDDTGWGVDTPDDLERIRSRMRKDG